jgi:hypothetical protein
MHFDSIRRGTRVVIRTAEGDFEGKALRKEDDTWLLDNNMRATPANVDRFVTNRRGAAGKAEAPTGCPAA